MSNIEPVCRTGRQGISNLKVIRQFIIHYSRLNELSWAGLFFIHYFKLVIVYSHISNSVNPPVLCLLRKSVIQVLQPGLFLLTGPAVHFYP